MSTRTIALAIVALAALAACDSDAPAPTEAVTETSGPTAFSKEGRRDKHVVVTESDVTRQLEDSPPTDNWVLYYRAANVGTASFRDGPGNPPQGDGSFEMFTAVPNDKFTLFNFDYHEERIADFKALAYQTYQSSAAVPVQLPSINLTIDMTGGAFVTGDFATLVFEPVYNVAQGTILATTWQKWDAIFGGQAIWWLTRDHPILGVRATTFTWDAFKTALPNATILGGIGPNQGSGGAALTASVDEFIVGVGRKHATTYDFELCTRKGHGDDRRFDNERGRGRDKCKNNNGRGDHDGDDDDEGNDDD
jgi:hypothetical protein